MRKLEHMKLYATYLGENDAILPIMGTLENGECPNLRSLSLTLCNLTATAGEAVFPCPGGSL